MAIPTGSGTETLHSHHFTEIDGAQDLIYGAQHHIYTVLSVVIYCGAVAAATDIIRFYMSAWDNHGGISEAEVNIFQANIAPLETFVWNDKFSFNGYEPTGMSGTLSTAAEQIALAAQGGSVDQVFKCTCSNVADDYDVTVTYIDQDFS